MIIIFIIISVLRLVLGFYILLLLIKLLKLQHIMSEHEKIKKELKRK